MFSFCAKFCAGMVPDADYLFSLVEPMFSYEGSSKWALEHTTLDNLQDVLISLEDT